MHHVVTNRLHFCFALFVLLTLVCSQASRAGSDRAREQRLTDQMVEAILEGDPVTLGAQPDDFLGIYMTSDTARGSVLILHGRGIHPDWPDLINPLRVDLTEHGWNTLSIQLPVLAKSAEYNDYVPIFPEAIPRIEAALAYLRQHSSGPIVIAAHSCGTHMVQHWIQQRSHAATRLFDGYIGIGMGATDYQQPMQEPFILAKIPTPVLDIYAELDYPAVHRTAPERLHLIRQAGHPQSQQQVVPQAAHEFREHSTALIRQIAAWLNQAFPLNQP
ncbi:MAG: DUF3530 family protein [Pseudomonadota bacterium]